MVDQLLPELWDDESGYAVELFVTPNEITPYLCKICNKVCRDAVNVICKTMGKNCLCCRLCIEAKKSSLKSSLSSTDNYCLCCMLLENYSDSDLISRQDIIKDHEWKSDISSFINKKIGKLKVNCPFSKSLQRLDSEDSDSSSSEEEEEEEEEQQQNKCHFQNRSLKNLQSHLSRKHGAEMLQLSYNKTRDIIRSEKSHNSHESQDQTVYKSIKEGERGKILKSKTFQLSVDSLTIRSDFNGKATHAIEKTEPSKFNKKSASVIIPNKEDIASFVSSSSSTYKGSISTKIHNDHTIKAITRSCSNFHEKEGKKTIEKELKKESSLKTTKNPPAVPQKSNHRREGSKQKNSDKNTDKNKTGKKSSTTSKRKNVEVEIIKDESEEEEEEEDVELVFRNEQNPRCDSDEDESEDRDGINDVNSFENPFYFVFYDYSTQSKKNTMKIIMGSCYGAAIGDAIANYVISSTGSIDETRMEEIMEIGEQEYDEKTSERQYDPILGQTTDITEMGVCVARGLVKMLSDNNKSNCKENPKDFVTMKFIAEEYREWWKTKPSGNNSAFMDRIVQGNTLKKMRKIAHQKPSELEEPLDNGSLMRCIPLIVYGIRLQPDQLFNLIRLENSLTHANYTIYYAVTAYALAIQYLIRHPEKRTRHTLAVQYAEDFLNVKKLEKNKIRNEFKAIYSVKDWLDRAKTRAKDENYKFFDSQELKNHIKISFQRAFFHLYRGDTFKHAIEETLRSSTDAETNCCIVGGLMGAYCGITPLCKWKDKIDQWNHYNNRNKKPREKYHAKHYNKYIPILFNYALRPKPEKYELQDNPYSVVDKSKKEFIL